MLHIGKLDRCCTDLQMKEHNRALMNGDPWMAALQKEEDKQKISKICD